MPHDDFAIEPVKGLPELPPEGEHVLWQGRPQTWRLAREAFALYWVMGYFAALGVWRVLANLDAGLVALRGFLPFAVLALIVGALILAMAAVQARTTVYTVTNRRVAMRIGAALTVTLNLPYRWIGSADLKLNRDGTGTVVMQLMGTTRLSYLVCWPHVRPWRMAKTEPALRAIPDAERVARLIAEAAETRLTEQVAERGGLAVAAE
ncbi:photosynthetic complex putative assembly protein PuhB [Pontivivens ytuae]|uniref:PH domain-containing protein n=1 Tax=Pontivivens ytuae TaxID=2789856 RepID=A0A7S9QCU1_9RHOB|nr:photosynthetic complex putative assembly protein PuhB [Pontivivens ytuae]QPH53451.1 PH domain-containing protein [Pontivivens ytuae]